MEREFLLSSLMVIAGTLTLLAAAPWPSAITPQSSARQWERASWRALWWPCVPVLVTMFVLIGWAVREPDPSDERLPVSAMIIGGLLLVLWLRAVIRAIRALTDRKPVVAATVGLWRSHIVLSAAFTAQLDADALGAVMAHETAHLRHRDPVRIWVAQFITDLQWPWPAAQGRFDRWRYTLELARDEEARVDGADGADLAAAILLAAESHRPCAADAPLIDGSIGIEERIGRLLMTPVREEQPPPAALSALPVIALFWSLFGLLSGLRFGDALVQTIVKWL